MYIFVSTSRMYILDMYILDAVMLARYKYDSLGQKAHHRLHRVPLLPFVTAIHLHPKRV